MVRLFFKELKVYNLCEKIGDGWTVVNCYSTPDKALEKAKELYPISKERLEQTTIVEVTVY